jgi:hypothetical protein
MRSKITLSLIVGFLPLLVYQWVFLLGIMSSVYLRAGYESALLKAVIYSYLGGSIVYPLVYVSCAIAAIWRKQEAALALKISIVPLVFLFVLAVLFAWIQFDTSMLR